MRIAHARIENWKNFRSLEIPLQRRMFIVGPNASGKSNLLDAFRFLRDIADPEGGFQWAVKQRGGVRQIRCLHARRQPSVIIDLRMEISGDEWRYRLEFKQDSQQRAYVEREVVTRGGALVLQRPDEADREDPSRLSQTHLEQVNSNRLFREISDALARIEYLHVVPQLLRDKDRVRTKTDDPYGSDFLERIARTNQRTLRSRLRRLNEALKVAVPQLEELRLTPDDRGVPHLQGLYKHWRPNAGWQTEEQFSDGTLRLLGLLWAILDGTEPLLLEEPELSLHAGVVRHIAPMMARATRSNHRQIIVSTHSADLLSDPAIAPEEVILLQPTEDGTQARLSSSFPEIRALVESGAPVGEAVLSRTAPRNADQLALFSN